MTSGSCNSVEAKKLGDRTGYGNRQVLESCGTLSPTGLIRTGISRTGISRTGPKIER